MNVYSIFDRKLRQYGQLMLERNDFALQRGLADGIRANGEALLAKHPEDFDLYQVGEFNEETGVLQRLEVPRLSVNLLELVAVAPSLQKEG